jgi:hypothetical protein
MLGDGTEIVGEDVFFFRRLHEAGVSVHVDHALSWSIGHVHQRVLSNADASHPQPQDERRSVKVSFNGIR